MSDDARGHMPSAEELLRLNRTLDEQVRTLVKTEQRLFISQRDLARRNLRLDTLTKFAIEAAEVTDARAILARAIDALSVVFAVDQAVAFVASGERRFVAVAARDVQRGDHALERDVRCELAHALPMEPIVTTIDGLRGRGLRPLLDCVDSVFSQEAAPDAVVVVLPLIPRGDAPLGVLVVRRLDTAVSFHEELPSAEDVGYLALFARLVGANVNNAQLVLDLQSSYERLAQAQRDTVERERLVALGQFAAVVAHEVRNPLGVIFNIVSILQRDIRNEQTRGLLSMLGEESHRLNRIVSDLLDFARPNPTTLHAEPLQRIVHSAIESTIVALPDARINAALDDNLPALVVDARMVRQAILNLIVNAVQASRHGEAVVVRAGVDDDGTCAVAVENRGDAIPPDVLSRIFDPFFTTKANGTGLGLSVVKRVAEAHGGRVDVTSDADRTVVSLRLPLRRDAATAR